MAEIKVKKVTGKDLGFSKRELYATVCYYYPRYSLVEVQNLPGRDVQLLLKTARKIEAQRMYNLTQITAAPHSRKQVNVKKLIDYFKKMAGF